MTQIIHTAADSGGREPPEIPGFEQTEEEWKLRVDYYEQFVEEVTGVEATSDLTPQQMKTIQSRIEGCIEGYKRSGSCACSEFAKYEHVDSIDVVQDLSRFFRVLVASRVEGQAAL